MNRNQPSGSLRRSVKGGATAIAASVCLLVSASRPARACFELHGPYQSESPLIDGIAGSAAIMPAMGVASACGILMLPADFYWKVARPEDDFGTHASSPVCVYPSAVVAASIYLAVGFPSYAGKVLWDRAAGAARGGGNEAVSRPLPAQI